MAPLQKSILETISFFDCLSMPLHAEEIWQYLWRFRAGKGEVRRALDEMVRAHELDWHDNFFVLPGRGEDLVMAYVESRSYTERLWRRVRRAKRWLQWLPFIRGVCVCNSLAFGNVHKGSDIDLLIIVSPGHLWHARFLATLALHNTRLRRHGNKIAGRICLSFFVTTDALDFEKMKIAEDDIYLSYWVRTLKPIFGLDAYETLKTKNAWVVADTPNFTGVRRTPLMPRGVLASWYQRVDEAFLKATRLDRLCERWLKSWMKPRAEQKAKELGVDSGVVITDHIQKFHDRDRRGEIRRMWHERAE